MSTERTLKLVVAFDGTNYAGWQRQKGVATIQAELEAKLSLMTGEAVSVQGSGRTDAGVHALGMVAGFRTQSRVPCAGFQKGLNSLLDPAIRVLAVEEREPGFHARRSALSKTYSYRVTTGPVCLPTDRLYAHHEARPLDLPAMAASLLLLEGEHDFSSFEAAGSRDLEKTGGRGAVRRILRAFIRPDPARADGFAFVLTGDGFLRHMVRNIAGTVLEVGRGRLSVEEFGQVLAGRNRELAGPTAPACGLFLEEVHY